MHGYRQTLRVSTTRQEGGGAMAAPENTRNGGVTLNLRINALRKIIELAEADFRADWPSICHRNTGKALIDRIGFKPYIGHDGDARTLRISYAAAFEAARRDSLEVGKIVAGG